MVEKVNGPLKKEEMKFKFYPDSAEQIKKSLEGIKPQVEKAFKEAIERVNKEKVDWEQRTGRTRGR